MQKIKYEDEEDFDFKRQFELEQKLQEPKSLSKFKDILNAAIDLNKKKQIQLKAFEQRTVPQEQENFNQQQLEWVQEQTDEVLTYQQYLKTKLDEVLKAKLLTDRKINYFKDHLRYLKSQPDHVQREIDGRVKVMLKKTQYQANQFQKQMEKFRSQSEQNHEKQTRDIECCEQSVKEIQQKIKRYKQQNYELLQQIAQLSEQEEQKKIKLQECFRVSEYIEFFIDVKQKIVDKINGEQTEINQIDQQNCPCEKHLTRDEIINYVDQFYKTQDISLLTEQILNTYNYLIEHQNMQTNEYDFYTEEKTLRQQQIMLLDQELNVLKVITTVESEDQQDFGSFNNTIIEGPTVFHENYQLNYHLQGYQLNLITIYEKLLDMNQRLCNNIIWLSESTKSVPKLLDNKCMQFLKTFTKNDLNIYIPSAIQSITLNKSTSQKYLGQFVNISKRNGSITSEEIINEQKIKSQYKISYEKLNRFQQHKDYEIIQQQWINLIKNDLILQQFQLEAHFDYIDQTLPTHEIVCQIYDVYFKLIKEYDLIKHYQIQFAQYKDVMRHIYKNNITHSQKGNTLKQKQINEVLSPYLQQTKQIQLRRLQEISNSTNYDDNMGFRTSSTKALNTADDAKYHEYFIHQSTKIRKQFPMLQDQMLSKTLQDIDVMKQKELNENYQQSDQISSDLDYLNQERRNLKGILSKQKQKPQTADTTQKKSTSRNSSNSKNKIIKQVQLLEKINKLSSSSRKLEFSDSFNSDLNRYTEKVQRKISDYYNSDLDMNFAQKDESRILNRPTLYEKTLSASKSVEPYPMTPISEQILSFDRDSLKYIQESGQMVGKKDKKFLIKRK